VFLVVDPVEVTATPSRRVDGYWDGAPENDGKLRAIARNLGR